MYHLRRPISTIKNSGVNVLAICSAGAGSQLEAAAEPPPVPHVFDMNASVSATEWHEQDA